MRAQRPCTGRVGSARWIPPSYYSLSGADPACASGAGTAGNSCGVHIHSGMTCLDDAGGHYYTGAVTSDPWTSIAYTSSSSGAASGTVVVDTGATSQQAEGRALIIHAYDGSRIGCAILSKSGFEAPLEAAGFVQFSVEPVCLLWCDPGQYEVAFRAALALNGAAKRRERDAASREVSSRRVCWRARQGWTHPREKHLSLIHI